MGGVLILTSCSEESLNTTQQKELNKVVAGTNPKEQNTSGGTKVYTNSPNGYDSPWDVKTLIPIQYYFNCYLSWDNIFVRVTPYIGIAYYDGADDGVYNPPTGVSYNLGGNYPNLYNNTIEYGNYIAANPIILEVNTSSAHELAIFSDYITQGLNDHCPVMPTVYQYPFNWDPIYFDLVNNDIVKSTQYYSLPPISPAPPQATPQEEQLLKDYGKVMYYKIEFSLGDPANYTDAVYALALEDGTGDAANNPLNITDAFGGDLYYHGAFSNNSMEKVADVNSSFIAPFSRNGQPINVSFLDRPLVIRSGYGGFVNLKVEYY